MPPFASPRVPAGAGPEEVGRGSTPPSGCSVFQSASRYRRPARIGTTHGSSALEQLMSFNSIKAFQPSGGVNVVVESPRGSTVKFKFDPKLDVFTVSRP